MGRTTNKAKETAKQTTKQRQQRQKAQQTEQTAQQTATEQIEQTAETEQTETTATEIAETATEQTTEQTATDIIEQNKETDFRDLKAIAKSFDVHDKTVFHLYVESRKQLKTESGEGTDNSVLIARYGEGSNGKGNLLSVWCRRKATDRKAKLVNVNREIKSEKHAFPCDYGLRFSVDDFAMFNSIADCKAILDSLYNEHTEIKHNETRFSLQSLTAINETLAKLYNAYDSNRAEQTAEQTKETAEQTKETAEQTKETA